MTLLFVGSKYFKKIKLLLLIFITFLMVIQVTLISSFDSRINQPNINENLNFLAGNLQKNGSQNSQTLNKTNKSDINKNLDKQFTSSSGWFYTKDNGERYDYRNHLFPYKQYADSIENKKTYYYNDLGNGLHVQQVIHENKLLIEISIGSYSIINYGLNEYKYQAIIVPNTESSLNYGVPSLPYKNFVFTIPKYTTFNSLKVSNQQFNPLFNLNIIPGPEPKYISDNNYTVENLYFDSNIYSQSDFGPKKTTEYKIVGINGNNGLYITFYPIQYSPLKKQAKIIFQQTIEIEFSDPISMDDIDFNLYFPIDNYGNDEGYVIICNESFVSSLYDFKAWKEKLGYDVSIKTIQNIYSSYSGRDSPEKIRNYIKAAYTENDTKYVFIVGDCNIVPVREVIDPAVYPYPGTLDNGTEPSDLYYECLDRDWDADGDSEFGETTDNVDLFPEVMVGRIPVNTPIEAKKVCNSIIRLESDPVSGDWMNNFLLIGPDCFTNGDGSNMIEEDLNQRFLYDSFFDVYRLYPTDGSLSHSAAIELLNTGIGIVDFFDHGAYDRWVDTLTASEALSLTNGNKSFFAFGMACETAAFDYELGEPTISEALFTNLAGGANAYIGATRIAWAGYHAFDGFHTQFWDNFLETVLENRIGCPKLAFQSALSNIVTKFDMSNSATLETIYQAIYFGDPAMRLYWKYNVTTASTCVDIDEEVQIITKCQQLLSNSPIVGNVDVRVSDPIGRTVYEDSLTTNSFGEYSANFYANELAGNYTVETMIHDPFEYTANTYFYVGNINVDVQLDSDPVYNNLVAFSGTSDLDGIANVSLIDKQGNILKSKLISVTSGYFSSDINNSAFGSLFLYIQVENGTSHGATSISFNVEKGNILIIADDSGDYGPSYPGGWADDNIGDSTNIADYVIALKEWYNISTFYTRYETVPTIEFLNNHDIVIVSVGDNIGYPLISPNSYLLDVLFEYHNSGGHLIFEGGSILDAMNSGYDNYFSKLFHVTYDQHLTNSGGLYLDNDDHPITQGLPGSILIEDGLGSYYVDNFNPTNGSTHVSAYSGSFVGGTAISALVPSYPLGGVIFTGFSIDAIANEANRYLLIQNMADFLLIPTLSVTLSDEALLLGTSEIITIHVEDSITNLPLFNANVELAGCGITKLNKTLSDGTCSIYINPSISGTIKVTVTKESYKDFSTVILVYEKPIIEINTNPTYLEGEIYQLVTIFTNDFYENTPISDCEVLLDGCGITESSHSNSSGMIDFTVIPTFVGKVTIQAKKSGHINTTSFLQVILFKNYNMFEIGFSWYDAHSNGFNLGMSGDDTYEILNLPFNFYYYDTFFSTLYVSSNGWFSFSDTSPLDFNNPTFPSTEYPYALAPFWDDLMANGNIYVWSTSEFVVIEYNNYNQLDGHLAGTFETVFFSDGTILFQYQTIQFDYGATIGLNYGLDIYYYTSYTNNLNEVSNYALFFTMGTYKQHDIKAGLEVPNLILFYPEMPSILINASVKNSGTYDENYINIELWINNTLEENTNYLELLIGSSETINHPWLPSSTGIYNITVYVETTTDENIRNNRITKMVTVKEPGDYLILQDANPWDYDWIFILDSYGITYDIIGSVDFGTFNLSLYQRVIITSDQPQIFYDNINNHLSWLETYTTNGGTLEIHAADNGWNGGSWVSSLPNNINYVYSKRNLIDIVDLMHPILKSPHIITDDELDEWYSSTHGYLTDIGDSEIILNGSGEPVLIQTTYGSGYFIISTQCLEWGYAQGDSKFLENILLYSPMKYTHDLGVYLEAPRLMKASTTSLLNASVTNRGLNDEFDVKLQLWINNNLEYDETYESLTIGETETLSYIWTPPEENIYNITVYSIPVTGESCLVNNIDTKNIPVLIITLISDFEGILSGWNWDGLWHSVNDSQLYGEVHSPVHSMYYGQDDTGDYNTGSDNSGTLMTPWYNLGAMVSSFTFWSWYETEESGHNYDLKDVYLITSDEIWIQLGYVSGEMKIWVQYSFDISSYASQTVRFAFVFDTVDSFLNSDRGWYVDDLTIFGTSTKVMVHNLITSLDAPSSVLFETNVLIIASVTNLGDFDEVDVTLQLWINDTLEDNVTFTSLMIGDIKNLTYSWNPLKIGYYNITAYTIPVTNEIDINNNKKTMYPLVDDVNLDFELGDFIKLEFPYDETQSTLITFMYMNYIDSLHVNVSLLDDLNNIGGWMSVNIITRMIEESHNAWPVGIYQSFQIETDITIGDQIYWLFIPGIVESTIYYEWNGKLLEAWKITLDDYLPGSYCYYHKDTGIWLYTWISQDSSEIHLIDTNMIDLNPPIVTISFPNGGETLSGMITVTWEANDPDGDCLTYKIYYWDSNMWIELATGLTISSFDWDTTLQSDGDYYKIRITANDGFLTSFDESDETFNIDNPDNPAITVIYPNGGETLSGMITVTWKANDLDGDSLTYTIYYWNSNTWIKLTSGLTIASYNWDTTLFANGNYYKIRITANDGLLSSMDESDEVFTLDNEPNTTTTTTATTILTSTTNTKKKAPGFESVLTVIILYFLGLTTILKRNRKIQRKE